MSQIRKHIRTAIRRLAGKIERSQSFEREFAEFRRLAEKTAPRFAMEWKVRFPCLNDKTENTTFDGHYIYHCAWAARAVAGINPEKHVDISSDLHFCTIVSAFVPVDFYDYRPAPLNLGGLASAKADLTRLPFADHSLQSLSCMHVVEHIGLGRYGDSLDPDGDLKAIAELKRVLAPGGSLLFVVPIGKPMLRFNAHRIYSYAQIIDYFTGLELAEFALIPDDYMRLGLVHEATQADADAQEYGCGCFRFKRCG